jgi:hypothetical protein
MVPVGSTIFTSPYRADQLCGPSSFFSNSHWGLFPKWSSGWSVKLTTQNKLNNNSVALVRERTIPTEQPPLVSEVTAKFADRGCHVVSVMDPYGRILAFLDRSRYFFFQAAPQLYSRGWVDPVPDALFRRKSGVAGNRIRSSGIVTRNSWPLDHSPKNIAEAKKTWVYAPIPLLLHGLS